LRTVFADLVLFISGDWRLFVLVSFLIVFFWLRARKLITQLAFESTLNTSFISYCIVRASSFKCVTLHLRKRMNE